MNPVWSKKQKPLRSLITASFSGSPTRTKFEPFDRKHESFGDYHLVVSGVIRISHQAGTRRTKFELFNSRDTDLGKRYMSKLTKHR
jgi:hypothetical protein